MGGNGTLAAKLDAQRQRDSGGEIDFSEITPDTEATALVGVAEDVRGVDHAGGEIGLCRQRGSEQQCREEESAHGAIIDGKEHEMPVFLMGRCFPAFAAALISFVIRV
jgi:hypothetical protein